MNLLNRLFGRTEKRALTFEDLAPIFGLIPTASGIAVTAETALRSPTVLAAVKVISETAGMLPIAVRRRIGMSWEKITDHPASRLLNGFGNPWTSSEQLRTQLTADALLHRNGAFAQVVRVRGEPRELHRLDPRAVTLKIDEVTGEPSYEVARAAGDKLTLGWRDIIHLQAPGSTFERSMCPTILAKDAIALDLVLANHEAKTFANGGLPRIVLSPEGQVTPEAIGNAIKFFTQQATGDNLGKPVVMPASFKEAFQSFGLQQMQFLELRRLAIEEIARAYNVPQTVIGDLSRGTYSNTEQQARAFLQKLLPWLEAWESALTRALIPAADRETIELEFIVEDLLRGDTAARSAAYRQAAGGAWLTRNEIRELEGRPPLPEGETLLTQAGQTDAADPKPKKPDDPEEPKDA